MYLARLLLGSLLILPVIGGLACAKSPEEKKFSGEALAFFEKKVRPVLVEHCQKCHGAKKQEGGLRLDSRSAMIKGGDSGIAVVAGKPEGSLLIDAINYGDQEMPPDGKLSPVAIDALSHWVKLGMPWPEELQAPPPVDPAKAAAEHWAFQPVRDAKPPQVKRADWPQTPIDRFVLARLEQAGLQPAAVTDRRTLLRRASFDLLGLPPTPEDVDAFLADESPDAFAKVIDKFLQSPHYGERWGRYWLDVVRYADTKGYVFFEDKKYPWAYTYRDYVIRAFNEDLPYDRFITEQLAADRLDLDDDKRALAAMGFLTVGDHFMNNVHDILDDQLDVVTRGLLGLTVSCARCHDHKFDPIKQDDYYSLYGILRSSEQPLVPPLFTPPANTEEYQKFDKELQTKLGKLQEFVEEKRTALVHGVRTRAGEYLMAVYGRRHQPNTDNFMLLADPKDLNPAMIRRWEIYLEKSRKTGDPVWAPWHALSALAEAEFSQRSQEVIAKLLADAEGAQPLNRLVIEAVFKEPPKTLEEVAKRYNSQLVAIDKKWQDLLKRATAEKEPVPTQLDDPAEEQLRQVFYGLHAPANVPRTFGWGFLTLLPDRAAQGVFKKLLKEVETWSTTGAGAPPRAMVMVDSAMPYDPQIFLRGNPNRKGRAVERRFLEVLQADRKPFTQGSGRLELARAIVDPKNPLTARVIVNRIWRNHFGAGLVSTPSDFGMQSDPPSHPELLDYLATSFVREGWSIKKLHRQIMLSSVYQQASDAREDAVLKDPGNRLLWRMNRRRLDFEAMRDTMLSASGSLDRKLGGPAVNIMQGAFTPRRTIYGMIDRMNLPGLFRTFDFPSPTASSPGREQTTIPPQALYFMNNQFVVECAKRMIGRPDVSKIVDRDARVVRIYHELFARDPSETEESLSQDFLGPKPSAVQWVQFAQALMLTNEFVFVD